MRAGSVKWRLCPRCVPKFRGTRFASGLGLNPGTVPRPLDHDDFEQLVASSLDELPLEYLEVLDHVPVLAADDGIAVGAYGLHHGAGHAHPDTPAQIVGYRETGVRALGL